MWTWLLVSLLAWNWSSLTSLYQFSDSYSVRLQMLPQRSSSLNLSHFQQALSLSCNSSPAFSFAPLVVVPLLVPVILLHLRLRVEDSKHPQPFEFATFTKKRVSQLWNRGYWASLSKQNTPLKDINPLESVRSDPDAYWAIQLEYWTVPCSYTEAFWPFTKKSILKNDNWNDKLQNLI